MTSALSESLDNLLEAARAVERAATRPWWKFWVRRPTAQDEFVGAAAAVLTAQLQDLGFKLDAIAKRLTKVDPKVEAATPEDQAK